MMRVSFLVAALVLSACAARTETYGASASGGLPPPLPPGLQVPLYDHYCASFSVGRGADAEFTRMIDAASAEGWEMVSISTAENWRLF
jgi:hypothetical protein